ncbi:MAG: ribbon-helix-helix domain-containing protein [Sporichthyaceae bacterium]
MRRKTSVYLEDADLARVALLAEMEGKSQAEIIRQAIRTYESPKRDIRDFALYRAGSSGDGRSIADLDMDELMEGFGE